MSTEMIPVKKLSDAVIGDFYPLSADKGTIFTENIPIRGNIGDYKTGDVINKADSLFDVISKLVGPTDNRHDHDERYILKTSIDIDELTNSTTRVPCSRLVKSKFDELTRLIDENLKHELLKETEYQRRLSADEIEDDVIYMTYETGYKVTFIGFYGEVLKEQIVNEGGDATAPIPPDIDDYIFSNWDKSFTNVQSDLVVTAIYNADPALYIITEDERKVMTEDEQNLLISE